MENIFKEFDDAEAILKGHFILSSGLHSDTYIQCARVLMDTGRATRVCKQLVEKICFNLNIEDIDIVASPAMGGVIVGFEIARLLDKPSIFCERSDGEFTFRRGFMMPKDANVLVVEDVVTTGKSSFEAIECIRNAGGNPVAEACLVDRSNGTANLGIPLISLVTVEVKTFKASEIPVELKDVPAIKPGSRWLNSSK